MNAQCSVKVYFCWRQLGHVVVKYDIPVQILLVWSKTLFEEQTKCFCAFRHDCLLRCKDILLLKAFHFWEFCCLSVYGIWEKHTLLILNMRTMPVANHLQRSVLICWKHVFFNMLLNTSISLQFFASFDV